MAAPRVFISSTYYDLKHVRNDIGDFIKSLGYEPVMHDRGGVAYTQTEPLEYDCYNELSNCDIIVCIIGNHFGTQSSSSDLSITMEELKKAIKSKKKIYVYISKDVYIENRTYVKNKETGSFVSAYTDDIKIHEYIDELSQNMKINPIEPFETTTDIIDNLRAQFAGLFQNLISRESSMTESKTAYDLQQTSDEIRTLISEIKTNNYEFFGKFKGTIFAQNLLTRKLQQICGIKEVKFFADNLEAVTELIELAGMRSKGYSKSDKAYIFEDDDFPTYRRLELSDKLFEDGDVIVDFRKNSEIEELVVLKKIEPATDDLPF